MDCTLWLSLGMLSTGIVQVLRSKEETEMFANLRYPGYLLTLLGIWKIVGVAAILILKFPLLQEWTYAGFFFTMSGAGFSHIAVGDSAIELFGVLLLIMLTVARWYWRQGNRKAISDNLTN